jgi:uncharacterized membrane protein
VHEVLVRLAPLLAALALLAGPAAAADPDPRTARHALRGMLTMQGDAGVFRACGDKGREYLLVDASQGGEIAAAYRDLAASPGAPVFMELVGVVLQSPPGVRPDRALQAERLARAERTGPGCRRVFGRIEALALGASPAWQIEISPVGVTFASLEERGMLAFPPRGGDWPADGALHYEGRSPAGTLFLDLEPARCRDSSTGNLYPLTARAVLNGTEYRGCAFRGRSAAPAGPAASR